MSDWRLQGQKIYLSGTILYKVTFPQFWETAYRDKNPFYQKITDDAVRFVKEMNRGHEYLEGEKVQHFWHKHCEFCWEKALTDKSGVFYCTKDMKYWICEECFRDFCDQFHWQVKPESELFD